MNDLIYNGQTIQTQGDDMLCLTDMWRASDCPEGKRPANWARKDGSQFIDFIAKSLNVPVGHIVKGMRGGRSPKTWAHWQVGLAYAQYLSPAFHAWCNQVVRDHMMTLAKREETRQIGKVSRKNWASACINKGCDQNGLAHGTNAIYQKFFKKTAKQLKQEHGISNPRDGMRQSTLAALALTESLAAEHINEMTQHGNAPCISATSGCAEHVRDAVLKAQAARSTIHIR